MTNQQTTLQFYGADESAPPGTLGHALAAFDRLLAADLEYDAAMKDMFQPGSYSIEKANRSNAAVESRAKAIRACKELRK